jgi:hypothetical protein
VDRNWSGLKFYLRFWQAGRSGFRAEHQTYAPVADSVSDGGGADDPQGPWPHLEQQLIAGIREYVIELVRLRYSDFGPFRSAHTSRRFVDARVRTILVHDRLSRSCRPNREKTFAHSFRKPRFAEAWGSLRLGPRFNLSSGLQVCSGSRPLLIAAHRNKRRPFGQCTKRGLLHNDEGSVSNPQILADHLQTPSFVNVRDVPDLEPILAIYPLTISRLVRTYNPV